MRVTQIPCQSLTLDRSKADWDDSVKLNTETHLVCCMRIQSDDSKISAGMRELIIQGCMLDSMVCCLRKRLIQSGLWNAFGTLTMVIQCIGRRVHGKLLW